MSFCLPCKTETRIIFLLVTLCFENHSPSLIFHDSYINGSFLLKSCTYLSPTSKLAYSQTEAMPALGAYSSVLLWCLWNRQLPCPGWEGNGISWKVRSGTINKGVSATGTQNILRSRLASCGKSDTYRELLMSSLWVSESSAGAASFYSWSCGAKEECSSQPWRLHISTWVRKSCWIKPTPCRASERDNCAD